MAQQTVAGLAALIALFFVIAALQGCANSEQAHHAGPANIAAIVEIPGVPEFHGADIGADALRSRLGGE